MPTPKSNPNRNFSNQKWIIFLFYYNLLNKNFQLHISSWASLSCFFFLSFAYTPLWTVLAGLTEQPATGAKYLIVEKIIYHGRYRPKGLDYDIALLKLSQPLNFNGNLY